MKVLFGYTLDYIKRNRRSSISIMLAILMTSTMMSALCGYFYSFYCDNLNLILQKSGNWHGELFDTTLGSSLPAIKAFDSIEAIMIKGDWKVGKIDDSRRDYLIWRDANAEYWNSMPEGSVGILEGYAPKQAGEVALSKQYFEHHPELKLGDSLTLPLGNRISNDKIITPTDTAQPKEYFVQNDIVTLKVVGKLDIATSSNVPAYTAIGFLNPEEILPNDELTIYFRFHNIYDTYKELPKIAEALGYKKDEYGDYLLRYNTTYLTRKGVLAPEQIGVIPLLLVNQQILTFGVMGLLVVILFVLIIHNAFNLSSSARLSQLGIFASVGAAPKQIKYSVIMEALLLTAFPLPLGLLLGQIIISSFISFINQIEAHTELTIFAVGWQSILPAILLTLLTVWWSALIPARKISHMSPIVAIRQEGLEKLKKPKRISIIKFGKLFGLSGELAINALQARKRTYRTATISLTLSFLTLACFLCINSTSTASNAIYQEEEKRWAEQDILLTLYNVDTPQDYADITKRINNLDEIKEIHWYNTLSTAAWIPKDGFSAEFEQKGGFTSVEQKISGSQLPLLRDNKRRVNITILGLDDITFTDYCATLGINPAPFYEDNQWKSILYHTVLDVNTSTKRNPVLIPFFDIREKEFMTLTEATRDSYDGSFTFDIEIAKIADHLPPIGSTTFSVRYSAIQIMPIKQLNKLANNFSKSNAVRINGVIQVFNSSQITSTREDLEQICESYFGSGDYRLFDENEYYDNRASGKITTTLMLAFIAGLLTIIGLSNIWATVYGTLNARRKEFAMLRSVGLPPRGIHKMLLLESVLLGLTPILLSLPVIIILQCVFLSINEISFIEWLPFVPWLPLLLYIVAILGVIIVAYSTGSRKLLQENIIEIIKLDSI